MSQNENSSLQLSGDQQPPASTTTYSLEKYLNSDGGVTERLLKGLDVGLIVGRAQTVRNDVDRLADKIAQSSHSSG